MKHDIYTLTPALEAATSSVLQKAPNLNRLEDLTRDPAMALLTRLIWKALLKVQVSFVRSIYVPEPGQSAWLDEFGPAVFPHTHAWIRSCYHAPTIREVRMELLNELLNYSGVETIYRERRDSGDSSGYASTDTPAFYALNAGDIYTPTLYTKPGSPLLQIGCYADLVTAARR